MPKIPLQKFRDREYPLTPKSTIHYWAEEGYFHNRGPLAGLVEKIGGRWYVKMSAISDSADRVVTDIIAKIIREGDNNG